MDCADGDGEQQSTRDAEEGLCMALEPGALRPLPGTINRMRSGTVDLGGSVYFADFGGSGPAMVLVHGLGGSHCNWLAVGPSLSRYARVVAPDLAGFGRTPLAGRSAGVPANRELLDRFLDEVVGAPAILVGNSMGGLLAIMEAALQPAKVAGLVLVAPAQPRVRGARVDPRVLLAFTLYSTPWLGCWYLRRRAARLGPAGLVREVLEICCVDPSRVPRDVYDAHVTLAAERLASMPWASSAFIDATLSTLATLRRAEAFHDMVRKITLPTLLVQGTGDRLVPLAASQALARLRPDWTFEVFERTGHVPQLEDPAGFVSTVVRWLEGPGRRAAAASSSGAQRPPAAHLLTGHQPT
jgi:pimeloyl-ACP methyl ester carboxylesterase